jgi:probable F420-dependent oxidoreductase
MDIYALVPYKLLFETADGGAYSKTRDLAQELEGLGLTGLVTGDHIVDTGWKTPDHQSGRPWPDPFVILSFVAAATTRLLVGSRVIIVPYRQPFATAHAMATLDALSEGRTFFGMTPGYAEVEFEAFNIPLKGRGALADEYIRLITALLENETVDFDGQHYNVHGVGLLLRPVQSPRPPLWVGGFAHRAAARAVELGDAWTPNCANYQPHAGSRSSLSKAELAEEISWAQAARRDLGKPPLEFVISSGPFLSVTDTPAHRGRTRAQVERFTGVGTPDELIDEYREFKAVGATSFYVDCKNAETVDEYLGTMRSFLTKVVPALD